MPQARMSVKRRFSYLTLVVLISIYVFSLPKPFYGAGAQSWIKADKGILIKDGKPFKFIGANSVNLVFYDDWDLDVEKAIRTAKENNILVLRLYIDLGWGKDADFDRIFDTASKYGLYIILTFTDCCCVADYSDPKKYFEVRAPFCNITNPASVKAFKKLIKQVIERKNSVNGRIYRDDPTILAWDIANELEGRFFTENDVKRWVEDISGYIKTLDNNHLVTIGIATSPDTDPGHLTNMFNAPALDFFSFHFYPSIGEQDNKDDIVLKEADEKRLKSLAKAFGSLGKPVILEEFAVTNSIESNARGRSDPGLAASYNSAFKKYMDTAFSAGCSGVMFWGWGVPEEESVPMWWNKESHDSEDLKFCDFIGSYRIPG